MKKEDRYDRPGEKPWPYFWTWLELKHERIYDAMWWVIMGAAIAAIIISIIAVMR